MPRTQAGWDYPSKYPLIFIFSIITCLFLTIGCGDSKQEIRQIKSVKTINNTPLTSKEDGNYYFPKFSANDKKIFLTSANKRGIWSYDRSDNKITQLNTYPGAGQEPVFSRDGSKVYFKTDSIGTDRRKRSYLYEQDLYSGRLHSLLTEPVRHLMQIDLIDDKYLTFFDADQLMVIDLSTYQFQPAEKIAGPVWALYQNKIICYSEGEKSVLDPFPGANLIWFENISGGDGFLVYVVGRGLYKSDRKGETIVNLGNLRAARWSVINNLIAYMQDTDDGLKITGSDIYVTTPDGKLKFNLTDSPDRIEMYPEWSHDGSMIVYHTDDGEIFILSLEIK